MLLPPVCLSVGLHTLLTTIPTRVIAFRFIPNSVVTRPVEAVWVPLVQTPFFKLPRYVRLAMGWLALLGIVFGSSSRQHTAQRNVGGTEDGKVV